MHLSASLPWPRSVMSGLSRENPVPFSQIKHLAGVVIDFPQHKVLRVVGVRPSLGQSACVAGRAPEIHPLGGHITTAITAKSRGAGERPRR